MVDWLKFVCHTYYYFLIWQRKDITKTVVVLQLHLSITTCVSGDRKQVATIARFIDVLFYMPQSLKKQLVFVCFSAMETSHQFPVLWSNRLQLSIQPHLYLPLLSYAGGGIVPWKNSWLLFHVSFWWYIYDSILWSLIYSIYTDF